MDPSGCREKWQMKRPNLGKFWMYYNGSSCTFRNGFVLVPACAELNKFTNFGLLLPTFTINYFNFDTCWHPSSTVNSNVSYTSWRLLQFLSWWSGSLHSFWIFPVPVTATRKSLQITLIKRTAEVHLHSPEDSRALFGRRRQINCLPTPKCPSGPYQRKQSAQKRQSCAAHSRVLNRQATGEAKTRLSHPPHTGLVSSAPWALLQSPPPLKDVQSVQSVSTRLSGRSRCCWSFSFAHRGRMVSVSVPQFGRFQSKTLFLLFAASLFVVPLKSLPPVGFLLSTGGFTFIPTPIVLFPTIFYFLCFSNYGRMGEKEGQIRFKSALVC